MSGAASGHDRAAETLARTRGAVANVLVAVGLGIAASGVVLRRRADALAPPPGWVRPRWFLAGLALLAVASYLVRRGLLPEDPAARRRRFFRLHVASAAVAALAVPLGLAYGWFVRPELGVIAPFWAVALALGALAIPRGFEADDLLGPPVADGPEARTEAEAPPR